VLQRSIMKGKALKAPAAACKPRAPRVLPDPARPLPDAKDGMMSSQSAAAREAARRDIEIHRTTEAGEVINILRLGSHGDTIELEKGDMMRLYGDNGVTSSEILRLDTGAMAPGHAALPPFVSATQSDGGSVLGPLTVTGKGISFCKEQKPEGKAVDIMRIHTGEEGGNIVWVQGAEAEQALIYTAESQGYRLVYTAESQQVKTAESFEAVPATAEGNLGSPGGLSEVPEEVFASHGTMDPLECTVIEEALESIEEAVESAQNETV